jgi:undecaprenyl-diphosphatase
MVWRRLRERHPHVWAFFGRRLAPGEYLGLHLTAGLLVSLAAALLFFLIARAVVGREELTQLDESLAHHFVAHREAEPWSAATFRIITELGSFRFLSTFAVVVALVLLLRRHIMLAMVWLLALAGGGLIDGWLKLLFLRDRPPPELRDWSIDEASTSFPSGHSMGSIVAYGLLAYLLVRWWPRWWARVLAIAVLGALILAIGFSRTYLCAHWFSDVLGGFLAGTVWLAFCISGLEIVRRRRLHHQRALDEPASGG